MKKLIPAFAALSIPMILAACGTNAMPAATATTAPMVSLRLGLGLGAQTLSKQGLKGQGLPTGGFAVGASHLKVKVADSSGKAVTFKGGVYAPAGDGDAFLTLNAANGFGTTVLLPKGQYTFETIGKDGVDEQNTTGTLLAYSKTALTTVDASTPNVRLSVHAVMDALNSDLTFAMPTDDVYTNDQLDLRLHVRTSSVGQTAFNVPTSDYSVGVYSAVNGQLSANSVSKLGASVLAIGQSSDPTLTVTVPVTAWVRDGGAETASQQTQTVTFTHKVISGVVSVDVTAPTGTVTVDDATVDTSVTVKGTASDDTAVTEARLYDGTALVASTDVSEQGGSVSALTFPDGDGNWEASWTPTTAGTHTLTLIVNDAAGNETSVDQTVTVAAKSTMPAGQDYGVVTSTNVFDGYCWPPAVVDGHTGNFDGPCRLASASLTIPAGQKGWFTIQIPADALGDPSTDHASFPRQYIGGFTWNSDVQTGFDWEGVYTPSEAMVNSSYAAAGIEVTNRAQSTWPTSFRVFLDNSMNGYDNNVYFEFINGRSIDQ